MLKLLLFDWIDHFIFIFGFKWILVDWKLRIIKNFSSIYILFFFFSIYALSHATMCAIVYTPEHGWILNSSLCLSWYASICAKLPYWQRIGTHEMGIKKNNTQRKRGKYDESDKQPTSQPRATKKNKRKIACDCVRINNDDDNDNDNDERVGMCASSNRSYWCSKICTLVCVYVCD